MYEEFDVKLDRFGKIDVEYYTKKANELKAQQIASYIAFVKKALKGMMAFELSGIFSGPLAHR